VSIIYFCIQVRYSSTAIEQSVTAISTLFRQLNQLYSTTGSIT